MEINAGGMLSQAQVRESVRTIAQQVMPSFL
jgi:hypothetical protein